MLRVRPLIRRHDVETCGHHLAPAAPVMDVDLVVLAVVAPETEEDGRPLALAEPFLLQRPLEDEVAADLAIVLSGTLGDAIYEDTDRRLGAVRQRHSPARAHDSARRSASYALSPFRCSTTRRRMRPVNASVD